MRPAARIGDQISLAHHHKRRFVFGELDTEENSHRHQKRALYEKNTPTMRSVVLKRKKERAVENTHLNLGGLEAGDGRDLLSSSKHDVYVDVFLFKVVKTCASMRIFVFFALS